MHKIDGAGHIGNQFVPEDDLISRPPTELTGDWLNAVQGEIVSVVQAAGLVLSKPDNTQLLQAIRILKQPNLVKMTSSGNFITPADITADTVFEITLVGGGAGGGSGAQLGGGGGSGGCSTFFISGLLPSTAYAVLIGAGASGGSGGAAGGTGGTTQITIGGVVYSVDGGQAGGSNTSPNSRTSSQGGVSATITALPYINYLSPGTTNGSNISSVYTGSPGGSNVYGQGGRGGDSTGSAGGFDGVGFGAGGGAGVGGNPGGAGTSGLAIFKWVG
ncbi:glycine-rich domain-containing protein [Methylomonas rosea]|uniref:Glycine-rich domain-containing protein n=1 Tax=Methylomonas rosea TaxID=2952227 RepID=A0ABT1TMU5_9GAMM|nr:hypothetical protein [Methylomonas sp. WSC-7]MCQ8116091.1 hypothetical protein [Methylomonas sp. WSC-7]